MDLLSLLAPGGHAREFMRNAPDGGPWVDSFCDEIAKALQSRRLDVGFIVATHGAFSANACASGNGVQLNVKWSKDRGWSCYTAETLDDALDQMWRESHMLKELKNGTPQVRAEELG